MKVKIEFKTSSAAFEDAWDEALDVIMDQAFEAVDALASEEVTGVSKLKDFNGDTVGEARVER